MRSSDFMRAIPAGVRERLPAELRDFKTSVRAWLAQLYYGAEPRIHYEAWLLAPRYHQSPNNRLVEVGLHFESRVSGENERLLELCYRHLFEIKAELGHQVEAEPWSRGWTKIYEVLPHPEASFSVEFLDLVAGRMARYIQVLQPIIHPPSAAIERSRARGTRRASH